MSDLMFGFEKKNMADYKCHVREGKTIICFCIIHLNARRHQPVLKQRTETTLKKLKIHELIERFMKIQLDNVNHDIYVGIS